MSRSKVEFVICPKCKKDVQLPYGCIDAEIIKCHKCNTEFEVIVGTDDTTLKSLEELYGSD